MKVIEHLVNGEILSMGDPTQDVFNPSSVREGVNFSFPS